MRHLVLLAASAGRPDLAGAVTLRLPVVVVPPHSEREVCQYFEARTGRADQLLAGYRVRIRGQSHHFYLLDASGLTPLTRELVDGPPSACVPDQGMPRLVSALGPVAALRLPDDIRLPWHTPQPLVMNLHVVNPGSRPVAVRTRVHLVLRRAPAGARIATRWGMPARDIVVPPFSTATVGTRWTLDRPLALLTFGGHMHDRGIRLRAYRDGVPMYEQDDWRHPRELRYLTPEVLPAGTTLRVECLYDNGVDRPVFRCDDGNPCALQYGERAVDAMCNLQGYEVVP